MVLTHGIHPVFHDGGHLFIPSTAIGSVQSSSGRTVPYRMRSLPRAVRHRVSSPQGSSSNGCCLSRYHHGPTFARFSFPALTLGTVDMFYTETSGCGAKTGPVNGCGHIRASPVLAVLVTSTCRRQCSQESELEQLGRRKFGAGKLSAGPQYSVSNW